MLYDSIISYLVERGIIVPTCKNCGESIEEGKKFCPNCGTPVPTAKKCPNCGTECKLGVKFCPECGTKLQAEPAPMTTDQPIEQPQPAPGMPKQTPPSNQAPPVISPPLAGPASSENATPPPEQAANSTSPPSPGSFQQAAAMYQGSAADFQKQAKRTYFYYKTAFFFSGVGACGLFGFGLARDWLKAVLFLLIFCGVSLLFRFLEYSITHPDIHNPVDSGSLKEDQATFDRVYNRKTKENAILVVGGIIGVLFFLILKVGLQAEWGTSILIGLLLYAYVITVLSAFWAFKWVALILSVAVTAFCISHPLISLGILGYALDSGEESPSASYTQQAETPDVEILNTAVVYDEDGGAYLTVNLKWVNNTGATATPNDTFDLSVIQSGETLLPNFLFSGYNTWDKSVSPGSSYLCSGQFCLNNDYEDVEVQITSPYGMETYFTENYTFE